MQSHLAAAKVLITQLPLATVVSFDDAGKAKSGAPVVNSRAETLVSELFRLVLRMCQEGFAAKPSAETTHSQEHACVQAVQWVTEFACDLSRPLSALAAAVNGRVSNSSDVRMNEYLLATCETLCRDVTQRSSLDASATYALGIKALVVSFIQASCAFMHLFLF
jgi:hypothetical protein